MSVSRSAWRQRHLDLFDAMFVVDIGDAVVAAGLASHFSRSPRGRVSDSRDVFVFLIVNADDDRC